MVTAAPRVDTTVSAFERHGDDFLHVFRAMATSCEVRLETSDVSLAAEVGHVVETEARRIERKFSRYRSDSMIGHVNAGAGREIVVDDETAQLLDFATNCFEVSEGLFDITSGVLRRAWTFDGSDRVPDGAQIAALRQFVGWQKVRWRAPALLLPAGMEIDFGGLAKEYAVDTALAAAGRIADAPLLVNFGGDLRVSGPRRSGDPWKVAIESVEESGRMAGLLELHRGALATSGDARRFLLKDGVRYGHILDPRSMRPVEDAPRSVTVAAPTCTAAGMIATIAMLNGREAEEFLERESVRAWCIR
jgi:thiamine biosynthesis lipoprotein